MELKIYDKQGIVKMTVSPDNSSQWNHEVGVENVVTVNFTTWEFLVLEVGWYILVEGQRFSIKSEYRPKHIHDTKYTYNLKFYGREHDAQDILFCRLNQGDDDLESVFAYDGTPMDFLQKVVANMNRNTDGVVWKAGEVISANRQTVNFNGLYCWDALGEIARAFGTEWWMDGEYLNISKCERGESVSLGYGQGLKSGLTQNENTNAVKWFTRLIPVGSSKNIDKSKYGYATLQLPGREKYIDINTQYGLKEYREEAAFSEIYPHRVGTISSVRSEERTNEETGNFTVYYVKDSSLPFNPDEYMIGGEVIHMTFNSGDLAGKDFEVNWNNETKEFEIINQYPDENAQLPGGNLVPSADDTYVLWNISMPDEYIRAAEQELKTAVDVYLAEYSKDISVYSGNTDYIYISKNNVPLLLGQRVRLLSEIYFGNIGRDSRITRVSRKLNNLNEATIDCSDAIASSWKSSVDSSLNQLQFSVAKELAQTVIEILKTGDSGIPSDYNVLSSLRSLRTFLRKDQPDNAAGLITFLKGLSSKDDVIIGSEGYAEGMTGFGIKFSRDGSGEMERLVLRRELRVPSLVFNQTEVNIGDKWRAPGGGCIERVMPDVDDQGNILNTGTFWLKLEKGQIGAVFANAICMGIFHDWENTDNNATEDSDDSRGNRTYAGFTTSYFTITQISDYTDEEGVTYHRKQCRYQIRPVSDRWSGQAHPYEQMNFVCYGIFSTDKEQLKKYGTSVYETRTYRRMLWNQNTWEIASSNIAYQDGDLSNLNIHGMTMDGYSAYLNSVYFTGTVKQVKPDGTPIQVVNDREEWKPNTPYAYYDRVSWDGGLWLCVNENGTSTEPSDSDSSWLCQVKPGSSIKASGRWDSSKVPYSVNSIVTFAEKVWISNKETSELPFGTYTDKDGSRLTYNDGSYILVDTLIQSDDWDLLLDAPQLTDGKDGESLQARYSSDKSNWHSTFTEGDVWMQQRVGEKSIWSDPIRIVGEKGSAGVDGTYYDYQFAVNDSLTDAPTSGWQDTPPAVGEGQYLWLRTRLVDPNTSEENPWSVARVGGEKGDKGDSVSNMGVWKTGMAVPYLGMVTMGGRTFMAKVATTNPPMWCYTDKDGNRLLFADGGYVLTGEINTAEYDLVMQNGRDGKDGKGYEYIYIHTKDDNRPSTPVSEQIDDYVPSGWHDDPIGVTATLPYEWVSMRTKKDGIWSDYSTPGIWAKYAMDAILADLDNEMDNVALDSSGKTISPTQIKITASMYYGSVKQALTSITVGSIANVTSSHDLATGVITLFIAKSVFIPERSEIGITVKANINGVEESRTLKFTLAAVKAGANGQAAILYDIIASSSAIVKKKDGSYNVSSVSATRYKTVGTSISETTDGVLKYSIDGGSETVISNNTPIPIESVKTNVKFVLYNSDGLLLDKETVPLVEDGVDGDGFTLVGNWKSGLAVPKMGVVTMGGCAFAAKVATTNPPMWCYTDRDGNRLLYHDGGYVLTGEVNTEEYDLWVQSGQKGADGKDGKDGKDGIGQDGAQGIQGCIMLSSEWALNTEYRNDEALTSGTRYINTVLVRNDATETGWDAFKCKKTHVSSAATAPPNSTYWEEYGANVNGIFTSFILAKNAKINFLQGNQLLIQKNDGKVTAGISGSEEGKKVRFWAGAESPDEAPFRVDEMGNIIAEKGTFGGYLRTTLMDVVNSDATPVSSKYNVDFNAYRLNKNVYVDATFCEVVLPCSDDYSGVRVIIMDTYYAKSRTARNPTLIRTEDGSEIACGLLKTDALAGKYLVHAIRIDCGIVELIYKSYENAYGDKEKAWIVISQSCGTFEEYNE